MISETDTLFLSYGESFIPPSTFPMSSLVSTNAESTKEYRGVPSSIGIYSVGAVLGCGAFGEVRLGINKFNGEKVALKFLKKSEIQSMGAAERTSTEIQCLTSLDHRNIIRLHTVHEIPPILLLDNFVPLPIALFTAVHIIFAGRINFFCIAHNNQQFIKNYDMIDVISSPSPFII